MTDDRTRIERSATTSDYAEAPTVRTPAADTHDDPLIGHQIGPFSVKSVIASGGMGTVYLAVQASPHRKVALKVMQRGIASRSALRRFEFESQTLARLRHPNVAQVYDAGTHDDGAGSVPYFAMEFVPGARSVTDHANEKKLGTRDRLALFAKVCDAVHHGHQKGIIHRDLKPGNILVDATGEPKIIDFGVARATDSDLAVTTLQTDIGQLIGTLQYMSPEQCAADPDDIDTRSDVYALGVVLYELLTGALPYDVTRAVLSEAARMIRETPPGRPSTRDRTLRGDVETITLKALEKDRDRRYKSAEALADDLRHYLRSEPIQARPPSVAYQLSRFASRNKPVVIGAAAVLLVLVAGIVATGLALVRALDAEDLAQTRLTRVEKAEAEATRRAAELAHVAEFQADMLGGIDVPRMGSRLRDEALVEARAALTRSGATADEIEVRIGPLEEMLAEANFTDVALSALDENVLAGALETLDGEAFRDQPLVRARLLQTVATTFRKLGLLERATAPQAEALEIRSRNLGDDHADTLDSRHELGDLLHAQGRLDEAEAAFRAALAGRRRVLGDEHPDTITSIHYLGWVLHTQGKFDEAEPLHRDALVGSRRVFGGDHPQTLAAINNMGGLLLTRGKLDEAEPLLREALAGRRRTLGDFHLDTLISINNLGLLLQQQDRLAEAEPFAREALDGKRRTLGDEHPSTLGSINNMGFLLQRQGKLDEAEPFLRETLAGCYRVLGDEHPNTLLTMGNLGGLLRLQGKLAEAEPLLREALEGNRRILGDGHPNTLRSGNAMGEWLNAAERYAESESLLRGTLGIDADALGTNRWRLAETRSLLGAALTGLERFEEADSLLRAGYAGLDAGLPSGRREEDLPPAIARLVDHYDAWGKPEEADAWRARLAEAGGHAP